MSKKQLGAEADKAKPGGLCPGKGSAFTFNTYLEAHQPGVFSWGQCWKCTRYLGCSTCTTSNVAEVLCRICGAWGTETAFHHHGAILKRDKIPATPFADYPSSWRSKYEPHPMEGEQQAIPAIIANAEPRRMP